MSILDDIPRNCYNPSFNDIAVNRSYGGIRTALIIEYVRAIRKAYNNRELRFYFNGKVKRGVLFSIALHLVQQGNLSYHMKNYGIPLFIACSLFITEQSTSPGVTQYVTADIVALNGQRNDDIFVFLTDVLPRCRVK